MALLHPTVMHLAPILPCVFHLALFFFSVVTNSIRCPRCRTMCGAKTVLNRVGRAEEHREHAEA